MAGGGGGDSSRSLDQTATWAVAVVCAVLIIISIVIEKVIHKLGTWLTNRHKSAMYEALEKVKAELMILGFISLILVFGQNYIPGICIPSHVANRMLPCPVADEKTGEEEHNRRLLWYEHRVLAARTPLKCKEGMISLISVEGLHQLHILVFFLAIFHVFYSATTMWLGKLKIRGWKHWEKETASLHYKVSNDPSRFRLAHETSFVRAHTSFWTRIPIFFYIGCFLRQFFRSVTESDYLTLRNGFISVHLAPGSNFNFQKYIKRSLEDDFKLVVGVSPVLWVSFVVVVLLNVSGWNALRWAHFIPLLIILAVGTKLQAILTKMALEISDTQTVVQGIPCVRLSDKYFWFGCPQLVLHLIHFALFQNAFLMTYFLWMSYEFDNESCFNENRVFIILKFASGGGTLFLCSYITLPLYALVTQMGSHMKKSIFDEEMFRALKNWHASAVNDKRNKLGTRSKSSLLRGGNQLSSGLHRFKTFAAGARSYPHHNHDDDLKNDMSSMPLASKAANYTPSYPYNDDDDEQDELKNDLSSSSKDAILQVDGDENEVEMCCFDHGRQEIKNEDDDDFEFSKPALQR